MSKTKKLSWDDFYSLQRFGMTTGLDNIRLFSEMLQHPERKFPSIHIAGTNGKGSVTAMLDCILRSAGLKVGRYTSPHILNFSERIHIAGEPITDIAVFDFLEEHWDAIQEHHFTFFETATAMAFQAFAEAEIDIAVVEVGLGGTFDATRIVDSILSIFTRIDVDHIERLGKDPVDIARDKAGIMRNNVPAVSSAQHQAVYDVLIASAQHVGCELHKAEESVQFPTLHIDDHGIQGSAIVKNELNLGSFHLPLIGTFQVENLKTALTACSLLINDHPEIDQNAIVTGLDQVQWPGRLQSLSNSAMVILDVGHNPSALNSVFSDIKAIWHPRRIFTLFGVMADKDVPAMIEVLRQNSEFGFLVSLPCERAMAVEKLAEIAAEADWAYLPFKTVREAIEAAHKELKSDDLLLIAGSHYLAEEVLKTEIYS